MAKLELPKIVDLGIEWVVLGFYLFKTRFSALLRYEAERGGDKTRREFTL